MERAGDPLDDDLLGRPGPGAEPLTDALLDVSRALVAVAARSIDDLAAELSLTQFRALTVLHRSGPLPVTALADAVGVHQSSATRIAARLARARLVTRAKSEGDRRLTVVGLAPAGAALVERVLARRRADIAAVVRSMPDTQVVTTVAALEAFAAACLDSAGRTVGASGPDGGHERGPTNDWAM